MVRQTDAPAAEYFPEDIPYPVEPFPPDPALAPLPAVELETPAEPREFREPRGAGVAVARREWFGSPGSPTAADTVAQLEPPRLEILQEVEPAETDPPAAAPAAGLGYVAAEVDTARNEPPEYPRAARRRGLEGQVRVRVRVSVAGTALQIRIATSSGYEILDEAALEAVARWHFTPAREGGRPVEGEIVVPVRFQLRSGAISR